jgi:predicted ester cyclase
LRSFPGIQFVITNVIESGDSVAVEYRVHAVHKGPLEAPSGTIPATDRTIDFAGAEFFEIHRGKIVTERNYVDSLELVRQLGLMPAGR